ncbi:quinolinate synthase NadA [Clostridium sp. SHJSY1]|uniref:quinolinate synthase NadA n=1 Tax=Clostridium sp. SHJSY1 TaxID=2942483 RepID=UPI0028741D69|nr:quinolinate synthase NadA [Clostridium sp. SHJSY1]MDS0524428.1 quinolinate synthase NadA [Clostridium sp. SHJSY1]
MNLVKEIERLKKEKGALILAHLYQPGEVQEVADIVGDSYFLSKKAVESPANLIIFCGVRFMAESAKILSPHKKVLLPAEESRCPMADMALIDRLEDLKKSHPNAKVISYINTNLDIKAVSDVCVTSSSALKIMNNIREKEIIFLPDRNLGEFIAEHFPDKKFILYQGFCPTHERVEGPDIIELKEKYPSYEILVHPECNKEVRNFANYIGSTSEIINYANNSSSKGFIVVTEEGVLHQMKKKNPNKEFIPLRNSMICPNMKMTNLQKVYDCLANETNEITIDEEMRLKAYKALENMHILGDD